MRLRQLRRIAMLQCGNLRLCVWRDGLWRTGADEQEKNTGQYSFHIVPLALSGFPRSDARDVGCTNRNIIFATAISVRTSSAVGTCHLAPCCYIRHANSLRQNERRLGLAGLAKKYLPCGPHSPMKSILASRQCFPLPTGSMTILQRSRSGPHAGM